VDGLGEDREKQLLVNLEESGRKRADCVIGKIIEHKATVRQTAKEFGVSKSTIHIVVTK